MGRDAIDVMRLDGIAVSLRDLLARVDRMRAPEWGVERGDDHESFTFRRGGFVAVATMPHRAHRTHFGLRLGSELGAHELDEAAARELLVWLRIRLELLDTRRDAFAPTPPAQLADSGDSDEAGQG